MRRPVPRLYRSARDEQERERALPGMAGRHLGEAFLSLFVELGGLRPDEAVLEPGCGTGRMAEPLAGYLSDAGSYDGFDPVPEAIEWCQRHIGARRPNFRFQHLDLRNRFYNPKGKLDPKRFAFPYADGAFDFAFLTSVFTHMRPGEVSHYLAELHRVVRPAGRCLITAFLINEESRAATAAGRATRQFRHRGRGYLYDSRALAERAVAYREEDLLRLIASAGLEPRAVHYGRWSGRRDGLSGQDVLIVERP